MNTFEIEPHVIEQRLKDQNFSVYYKSLRESTLMRDQTFIHIDWLNKRVKITNPTRTIQYEECLDETDGATKLILKGVKQVEDDKIDIQHEVRRL